MGNIYAIINKLTNRPVYVGQTIKPIEDRWREHINEANRNSGFAIHKALRKYGVNNFDVQLLESQIKIQDLDNKEQYWIKKLHTHISENGYNLTWGGETCSDKLRKKIYQYDLEGNFLKEFPSLMDASRALNIAHGNICKVAEHELRTCGGFRWSYTKESKLAPLPNNYTGSSKQIGQYDLEDNLIQIFPSTKEAARQLNKSQGNISSAANGKRKTAYGFKWKFLT